MITDDCGLHLQILCLYARINFKSDKKLGDIFRILYFTILLNLWKTVLFVIVISISIECVTVIVDCSGGI